MQSRMEKYKYNHEKEDARSSRNKNLYSEVYNSDFYTEIAELENTNEVDLSKIKELLGSREDYQKAKTYKEILSPKEEDELLDLMVDEEEEDKEYDFNRVLEKAKEDRKESETYRHSTTEYDILKKLNLLSIEEKANDMLKTNQKEEEKLRELIDTITMKKEEILDTEKTAGLEFLEELKGETVVLNGAETALQNDTTIIDDEISKTTLVGEMVVADSKKDKTRKTKLEDDIDHSFFTTSLSLTKGDFEDFDELEKSSKSSVVLKVFLILLLLAVIAGGIFVFTTYISA